MIYLKQKLSKFLIKIGVQCFEFATTLGYEPEGDTIRTKHTKVIVSKQQNLNNEENFVKMSSEELNEILNLLGIEAKSFRLKENIIKGEEDDIRKIKQVCDYKDSNGRILN